MRIIAAALLALTLISSPLTAEIPDIESFRVVPQFPQPADGSFGVVGSTTPNGRFLLWDGDTVYLQQGVSGHELAPIGTGYLGDPGFVSVTPNGNTVALGGGFNGRLYLFSFKNPSDFEDGDGYDVPTHFGGAFLNNRLLLVDRGTDDFSTSELLVIDTGALAEGAGSVTSARSVLPIMRLPEAPEDIITKPLGSFSSQVFVNAARTRAYVMDANTRELRYFLVQDIIDAFENSTTLDWATDGVPVGAPGDFFDGGIAGINPDNELIIGGSEGFGQPGGVMYVDPTEPAMVLATLDPAGTQPYYSVIYNRTTDEIIAIDGSGLPLEAYATEDGIAPVPPVTPCPIFDDILEQWTDLTTEFELAERSVDLDGDGLPEFAVLRMINGIGCPRTGSLNEATRVAFDLNLRAFDGDVNTEALAEYREVIAALMITSAAVQTAVVELLADNGFVLAGDYTTVTCTSGEPCQPEFVEQPIVLLEERAAREINEPYSATGDIDNDGVTNLREYNNVIESGGDISDFILAAGSAQLNGTGGIQRHAGSGGGCFVATAAYGTPMADEINVLRDVRDAHLLTNALGTSFVDTYYRISPALADAIAQSPLLRSVARSILTPLILLANTLSANLSVGIGLLLLTGFWLRSNRRRTRTSL